MLLMRLFRRSTTFLRTEVFVLPSRIIVLAFILFMLALPLWLDDPYVMRILIMASIFATFAASWDFLSGYSGQVNFGHALFFGDRKSTSLNSSHVDISYAVFCLKKKKK